MADQFALTAPEAPMRGSADFSDCTTWRYELTRCWSADPSAPYVCFVGLNPSVAGAVDNDPTVTREIGFTRRLGYQSYRKGNLFALVSTDPRGLPRAADPLGPENKIALYRMVSGAALVVCAWGANAFARERARSFVAFWQVEGVKLWCLGTNADGSPRHPLYLKSDTALEPYWVSA